MLTEAGARRDIRNYEGHQAGPMQSLLLSHLAGDLLEAVNQHSLAVTAATSNTAINGIYAPNGLKNGQVIYIHTQAHFHICFSADAIGRWRLCKGKPDAPATPPGNLDRPFTVADVGTPPLAFEVFRGIHISCFMRWFQFPGVFFTYTNRKLLEMLFKPMGGGASITEMLFKPIPYVLDFWYRRSSVLA